MKLITDLPVDVLWTIAKHLQHADLQRLRFVNRILHDIASQIVLRSVRVPFYQYRRINMTHTMDSDSDPKKATDLVPVSQRMPSGGAGALPALSRHTRHLVFNPIGGAFTDPDNDIAADVFADMMNIISHLSSLETFELNWHPNRHDYEKVRGMFEDMIADTAAAVILATGGQLKKLIISTSIGKTHIPKALCSVRGLEYFKFTQDMNSYRCRAGRPRKRLGVQYSCQPDCRPLPEPITAILENNPHIMELDIYSGCVGTGNRPEYYFAPNLVNLRSLAFAGTSLRSLPHGHLLPLNPLRNLRHLRIENTYSEHNLDGLWKSLQAAGTALVTLRTKQISPSFNNYASTFVGLEELTINGIESSPAYVQSAGRFFDVVLPHHGNTLKVLQLSYALGTVDVPQWAFEPALWRYALRSLKVLKELCLFVSGALLPASGPRSPASTQLLLLQQVLDTLFGNPLDSESSDSSAQIPFLALKKLVISRPVPSFFGTAAGRRHGEEVFFANQVIPKLRCWSNQLEVFAIMSFRFGSGYKPILVAEWEMLKAQEAEEARLREQQNTNEGGAPQAAEEVWVRADPYQDNIGSRPELQIESDFKPHDGPYMFVPNPMIGA